MMPYLKDCYGNPSAIHSVGRKARVAIEKARKKVAELLQCSPGEIFFTSGGTEADNTAIIGVVESLGVKHIISSKIEHHAVLHTLDVLEKKGIEVTYLNLSEEGLVDYVELEELVKKHPHSLISLMHGNNEIANLLDMERIGKLAKEYSCYFHSDTVQTMGHYAYNFHELHIDFAVGSAHKLHGPKGVGFLYINSNSKITPYIHGGTQERNMRGGTENVTGIVGLAKALEIAYSNMKNHQQHILSLKKRMVKGLQSKIDGISFNGTSAQFDRSLYTVLNVSFPGFESNDMLLFNLDIEGVAASGGSACSSGSSLGSHVLAQLGIDQSRSAVRFSFSKYNTAEEVDFAIKKVEAVYKRR